MSPARSSTPPVAPAAPVPLPADLEAALKRLKLATVRRLGPEVLATAWVQGPVRASIAQTPTPRKSVLLPP
jgi:hypothetical protein